MTQCRLNYISVCEKLNEVDVRQPAKLFVQQSEIREIVF